VSNLIENNSGQIISFGNDPFNKTDDTHITDNTCMRGAGKLAFDSSGNAWRVAQGGGTRKILLVFVQRTGKQEVILMVLLLKAMVIFG